MINSRASYDFVTFPDGVIVNGGIMPLRSGSAANALRLEDVGFLYEAMCERQAAMGEMANHETLTKEIRAYPLSTIANGLTTLAPKFLKDFEPSKVEVASYDGNTIAGIYGNASTAPTASFATGSPLVAANVKNLFDSVATMRQFEAEGEVTLKNTDGSVSYTYGPDERFNRQKKYLSFTAGGKLLREYITCAWTETWSNKDGVVLEEEKGGYDYELFATSGTYKVDVGIDKKYVDDISAVAILRTSFIDHSGSDYTYHNYAIPVESTYADGSVSVDFSVMLAAADKLASDLGYAKPGYLGRQYHYYVWAITVLDLLAVCKLGEHTKF